MSARINRQRVPVDTGGGTDATPGIRSLITQSSRVPTVDQALIDHLKDTFKITLAPHHDLRNYDRQLGQQQVIEHLTALLAAQFDNT